MLDVQPERVHSDVLSGRRKEFRHSRTDVIVLVERRIHSHEGCYIGRQQVGFGTY